MTADQRIENYLKLEAILRKFFDEIKYCSTNCEFHCCYTDVPMASDQPSSTFADCYKLKIQREIIYGTGESDTLKNCRYKSDSGCILLTHKPPMCISHICDKYLNSINEKGYCKYSVLEVHSILLKVLDSDLSNNEFNECKEKIISMTNKTSVKIFK